ncbi:uncharacterized protein LOC122376805 [Amphibalanus amphitrite]|uniref:uncharacterized protein LOC122376805 n=1 Tax=Amphibalanus amphitrite TaxID=1232801 RepID=UPI001C90983D|nr:uncharacterized protein LOC122376805 [Amphibalanus amphitrite]
MAAYRMPLSLLSVTCLLATAAARPQFSPASSYSYRFAGPEQTKEESRDALGNIQGSYSVTYPDGGGTLTYSYSHRAAPPAFRTLSDGPLGPAGTVVAIGKNSKDNAFLIEMLQNRIESRDPPKVTETDAVIIEALPLEPERPVTSVRFQAAPRPGQNTASSGADGRPNEIRTGGRPLTRGSAGFTNSKESAFLGEIRQESLANEVLGGRNPPLVTDEAVIVEALPLDAERGI